MRKRHRRRPEATEEKKKKKMEKIARKREKIEETQISGVKGLRESWCIYKSMCSLWSMSDRRMCLVFIFVSVPFWLSVFPGESCLLGFSGSGFPSYLVGDLE